ncbi:TPA: hypothetical protein I7720_21845 [Vibrio vulnificus]|nr:hypothetical protein [Vibrio vulnificus]HAS8358258.1 hypothetical protein [Vibrio vulnificus]
MHGNDSWWCDQFFHPVILTNVGIYCIASTVAWFYRFIASVAVGFATLSPRHPHERGDLLYSEHRGLVLSLHYWCFC